MRNFHLSNLTLIIVSLWALFAPVHADENSSIWDSCQLTSPAMTFLSELDFPYWSQNSELLAMTSQFQGQAIPDMTVLNERITELGWVHLIYSDGSILSALIVVKRRSYEYYALVVNQAESLSNERVAILASNSYCGAFEIQRSDFDALKILSSRLQEDGLDS